MPFQYFAVTDPASLVGVRFERGKFREDDLESLYTENGDTRVNAILDALSRYQPESSISFGGSISGSVSMLSQAAFTEMVFLPIPGSNITS